MEVYGDTAAIYLHFAEQAADSPCFAGWARAVAADPEVLAWLEALPGLKRQPNLVFAAARWHGVPAPAPYDELRRALLADAGPIRETIRTRSTQTNEVGRLGALLPAFASVADELCLIELGASAGLCLQPDRFDYRWITPSGERTLGGSGGPSLTTVADGPVPVPTKRPRVVWRVGVDLNPLDVRDDDQMAWLENLVWPEHEDRRRQLRAAIASTRPDPPRIVTGDLLDQLPHLVAEAPAVPVVFHSAAAVYLDPGRRAELVATMTQLVESGSCHWISNEAPTVLPGIPVPEPLHPARFLLSVDGPPVAWAHGHGRSVTWL